MLKADTAGPAAIFGFRYTISITDSLLSQPQLRKHPACRYLASCCRGIAFTAKAIGLPAEPYHDLRLRSATGFSAAN